MGAVGRAAGGGRTQARCAAALAALALGAVAWGAHLTVYGGSTVGDAGIYAYAEHLAAGEGSGDARRGADGGFQPAASLLLVPVAFCPTTSTREQGFEHRPGGGGAGPTVRVRVREIEAGGPALRVRAAGAGGLWSGFACWIASGLEGLLAGLDPVAAGVVRPGRRAGDVGLCGGGAAGGCGPRVSSTVRSRSGRDGSARRQRGESWRRRSSSGSSWRSWSSGSPSSASWCRTRTGPRCRGRVSGGRWGIWTGRVGDTSRRSSSSAGGTSRCRCGRSRSRGAGAPR